MPGLVLITLLTLLLVPSFSRKKEQRFRGKLFARDRAAIGGVDFQIQVCVVGGRGEWQRYNKHLTQILSQPKSFHVR